METKKFMKSVRKYSDDWYQLQEAERRSRRESKRASRAVSFTSSQQSTCCQNSCILSHGYRDSVYFRRAIKIRLRRVKLVKQSGMQNLYMYNLSSMF